MTWSGKRRVEKCSTGVCVEWDSRQRSESRAIDADLKEREALS